MKAFQEQTPILPDADLNELKQAMKKGGAVISCLTAEKITGQNHSFCTPVKNRNRVLKANVSQSTRVAAYNRAVKEHNDWLNSTDIDETWNRVEGLVVKWGKEKVIQLISGFGK